MTEYLEAPAVSSKPKVFVLQGMGGCGKSQLALEYCQRSRDKKTFGTILWIDATSPDTLQQSFTGVAKDMGKPEFNPTDPEINFRYVEKRLGVQQQNWLLIFDNFDDPKAFHGTIKKYFPQVTMGSIIITTRHLEVTSLGHSLEVTRMLFDEGMELLFQKSQVSRDDRSEKEASAIVSRLGFHALAIDQAGSYIFKRHLDIASYLTHFNSRRAKVLNEHPDFWDYRRPLKNGPDKETELTVFTTWELSFQLISGNELERKDKEHILTLMAFFNKNGLSDQMFIPYARKQKDWMISCRNKGTWDVYSFQDILVELRNLSLLQSLAIQESAIFSLHPLIQDWIKLRISPATRKLFAEQSMILLGDLMESSDLNITSFQAKNLLLGHLDAVLSNKDEYIPTVDFLASGDLLNAAYWFSDFLWLQGRSTQAEEMCRIVVDGKTELFGNADPNTLNAQGALSRLFLEQGKHSEAEQLCRELLAMEMKVLGTDNVETLRSMNCLSRILHSQGKYTEAEAQCRKTLMLQKKVLGREHSDTLQSMNALASLLQDQIRHGEAETIYREALAISKKRLGEENLSVFELMNNLAAALMQQDKLDEAEPLYREALALKQKAFGKDHQMYF
jgi:tetratricopeptide (TPR) repeat protein